MASVTGPAGPARAKLSAMADRVLGHSVSPVKKARRRVNAKAKGNYGGAAPSSKSPGRAGGHAAPSSKSPGTGNSFTGGYDPSKFAKTGTAPGPKTPFTSGYTKGRYQKTGTAPGPRSMRTSGAAMSRFAKRGIARTVSPATAFAPSKYARTK